MHIRLFTGLSTSYNSLIFNVFFLFLCFTFQSCMNVSISVTLSAVFIQCTPALNPCWSSLQPLVSSCALGTGRTDDARYAELLVTGRGLRSVSWSKAGPLGHSQHWGRGRWPKHKEQRVQVRGRYTPNGEKRTWLRQCILLTVMSTVSLTFPKVNVSLKMI